MQGYLSSNDCNLEEFSKSLDHTLNQSDVPLAHDIKKNIPIYDVSQIDFLDNTQTLRTEWANVLHKTAGVLVLKNAYPDTSCIDAATLIFEKIIADEKAATGDKADHLLLQVQMIELGIQHKNFVSLIQILLLNISATLQWIPLVKLG